ncbi:MAG: TlpA family protein disulfide reductase [Gammaproteobacteria bacterium]|nr:TlpA family protein disulfide reductase [Gammaproteobacteria bacterium]
MVVAANLRSNVFLTVALIVTVIVLTGCDIDSSPLTKGKPTPEFDLINMQGNRVTFPDDFSGQVVLISFWADWCPSCKKEMAYFEPIFEKYEDNGLTILAINIEQSRETAMAFINDLSLSYDLLLDSKGSVAKQYGVTALPSAFIIDRDGNLHTRIFGESSPEVFGIILKVLL